MNPDKRTAFRESFKVALAMVIAYGISLAMGWDNPYWAGFAVAFCALSTIGQSLNKAALRMFGTLVATVAAFAIIALTNQDRWMFMVLLSAWVGFCTYMMSGSKHQYFWNCCGFVCVIICLDGGPNSADAFNIAMMRAQETGMGILVYSLVSIFLWPANSKASFDAAAKALASTQHQFFQACTGLMRGEGKSGDAKALGAKVMQAQGSFDQLLGAAETDSYAVKEVRKLWRGYQREASGVTETMERWLESFTEWQSLDLPRLLPNLAAFGAEFEFRFAQIEGMLAGRAPEREPEAVELAFDEAGVRALSHFQKAALAVTRDRLLQLERETRSMVAQVGEIAEFGEATSDHATAAAPKSRTVFVPDPDRLIGVVRVVFVLWLAFLAWIFVDGIPGGTGVVSMAGPLGMALAATPQVRVTMMLKPAAFGVFFASVVYLIIMPHLSSFRELAVVIFGVTFFFGYLFSSPKQALGRVFGLAMFVTIASVTNEQSYSFIAVATTALMMPTVFAMLAVTAYVPVSQVPEKAFLRLLGRFFRSCNFLVTEGDAGDRGRDSWWSRRRQAFHAQEVSTLPRKLAAWGKFIDPKAVPGTSPEQIQSLVGGLQGLARRVEELHEERDRAQAPYLVETLGDDVRAWRRAVERAFLALADDPAADGPEAMDHRLAEVKDHLEARIDASLGKAPAGVLVESDGEKFYRLLGAYRGVSESLVEFSKKAGAVDWACWREERFA